MRLKGKSALITGAGGGIGRAAALRFAREGAAVAVADIDAKAAEDTAHLIAAQGGRSIVVAMAVADSAQVDAAFSSVIEQFSQIDILYNNAAVTSLASTASIGDAELDRVFSINIKGMFYCCRAALPGMIARRSGVIVNNASITGIVGAPGMAAYATSKGAIITFTRTLALEQAENGIRFNCICPASIDTPMLQASFAAAPDPSLARANNVKRHPLGRLGTPEDVANLALFLASDEASFITGGTYVIDGGATIARRWRE